MNPDYELIPQRSVLSPEAYAIVAAIDPELAHLTLYDDWEVIQIKVDTTPMDFYFPIGDS